MPELPEVETTRRGLLPHLASRTITKVVLRNPSLRWPVPDNLPALLKGKKLQTIARRGKYLLFQFEPGCMLIHLGMSGSLRIASVPTELRKHDHVIWQTDSDIQLRFHDPRRFGSIHWTEEDPLLHPLLLNLGPEPLTRQFNGDYLYKVSRNRKVAVKNLLMNSHIVVGVGNIYTNETLFLAGIHPGKPADKINSEKYQELAVAIKRILQTSIKQGGTTLRDFVNASGNPGYFYQRLNVYDKADSPCIRCKRKIQLFKIGQRASYFCPHCQKG